MTSRGIALALSVVIALAACTGKPATTTPSPSSASPSRTDGASPSDRHTPTIDDTDVDPIAGPTPGDPSRRTDADGLVRYTDLAYGDDPAQRVDLTLPAGSGAHPLLVWFHSGGWIVGDKVENPFADLAEQGVAVASANYRMALTEWPGTFEDPEIVVDFLRARADDDGVDPDRVVLAGFSAGGHLAMLTMLAGDVSVSAAMSFAGPLDLRDLTNIPDQGGLGAAALLALLFDCPIDECPERVADASPSARIRADAAPAFVQAGTADPLVDSQMAVDFAAAATRAGAKVDLEVIDGLGHAVERTPAVAAFLAEHLAVPLP